MIPRKDQIGVLTETVMQALKGAQVLRPDSADNPTHYNRAYNAVTNALQGRATVNRVAEQAIQGALDQAKRACASCKPFEEKKVNG